VTNYDEYHEWRRSLSEMLEAAIKSGAIKPTAKAIAYDDLTPPFACTVCLAWCNDLLRACPNCGQPRGQEAI
jgi:hypothetical protein